MIRVEFALVLLAIVVTLAYPALGDTWFARLESRFSAISQRQFLSVVLTGVAALVLRAALLPILPKPEPIVHDEFGYLLAADTFAHGRLTNPPHRMWMSFEAPSILQKPTYQGIYPPAQGLVLALGQVLFGHPFWGVWLTAGLMCSAITWMLQGWLPPPWALLGGLIAVLRYEVFSNWGDSYWGGALGAFAGALVLGALPRVQSRPRARDTLLMALGLAILANNRPYEGFVLGVMVGLLLFQRILGKSGPPLTLSVRKILLPMAIALVLAGAWTCFYFYRVTGNPFTMPYQVERRTYAVVPFMAWQPLLARPVYNNPQIEKMYTQEERASYTISRSLLGPPMKMYLFWVFYVGPALSLPFVALIFFLPKDFSLRSMVPQTRTLTAIAAIFSLAVVLETFYNARYSGPATGILLALLLIAMRVIRQSGERGRFLMRALPVICVLTFSLRAGADVLHIPLKTYYEFAWCQRPPASFGRAAVQERLENTPGEHLVIVRYSLDHEPFAEWVYNDSEIDHSKVVWARDMGAVINKQLQEYFQGRHVWMLDADASPPQLQPLGAPVR